MTGIWTVARQTFTQCLRMRMTLVFVVMLSIGLAGMGFTATGDGTLNGRIRTFLDYSFMLTVLIPGIMTIFLTVGMVAGDIRRKQIFMLVTKPLSRWHYVLGRWLGVMFLNVVLLILAAVGIYGSVKYLESQPAINLADRRAVMNEVLISRDRIKPEPVDYSAELARRMKELTSDSRRFEEALVAYQVKGARTSEEARSFIEKEISRQIEEEAQTVAPSGIIGWKFLAPYIHDARIFRNAKILLVKSDTGQVLLEADDSVTCQLVNDSPIEINELKGSVAWFDLKRFEARFPKDQTLYFESRNIVAGRSVTIALDPALQLTYKPVPTGTFSDMPYAYGFWRIANEKGDKVFRCKREDPSNQQTTLVIPASIALDGGSIKVEYSNLNNPADPMLWQLWENPQTKASTLKLETDRIFMLYRVGSFEMNFVKALLLVLVELAFLAAMGGLLGSFLSLPVGSVMALVLLVFGRVQDFILAAASSLGSHNNFEEFVNVTCGYFLRFLAFLAVPDLSAISPEERLSDGIRITWTFVVTVSAAPMLARSAIMLALGCFIFSRREIGRVQV